MSRIQLSVPWLRARQSEGTYADLLVPALKVRVGKSGVKTFSAIAWRDGRSIRTTFGRFPTVSLAEARRRAEAFSRGDVTTSVDSVDDDVAPNRSDVGADLPVTVLLEDYVGRMRRRGQPAADTYADSFWRGKRSFASFLVRRHGRLPSAADITPDDAAAWLRERSATAPFHAHYLRGQLHAAFQWGLRRRHDWTGEGRDYGLVHNPIAAVPTGRKPPARDRVLSVEELQAVWRAVKPANTAHRVLQLIIAMGGLRVTEVSESSKEWWKDDTLTLPKTKNGRAHSLPLTEAAKPIIALSSQLAGPASDWLFPNAHAPSAPITRNGIIRATKGLIARLDIEHFTPRDLRRTMKTHLIEREVDERWLEIWHNHGQTAGVARKHYIRAEYTEIKRKTAEEIDAFVVDITNDSA